MAHLSGRWAALISLFLLSVPQQTVAQLAFQVSADSIPVQEFQDSPSFPWAGGINAGQYSAMDLNLDGTLDVLVFDRQGNRVLPFVQVGSPGFPAFEYHPELREVFPPMQDWALGRDFNEDGKVDLFTAKDGGMIVYKNTSTPATGLEFTPFQLTPVMSTIPGAGMQMIEIPASDIPVLTDLDGDSDLDVLVFNLLGTLVDYHKNLSFETFGNNETLAFILEEACWGHMMEDDANATISLGVTCKTGGTTGGEENKHAGSSMLSLDLDGDGDHELILGDVSTSNLLLLTNGGSAFHADITSFTTGFPVSNPVNLDLFPAAYFLDVDNDDIRDLIVSPNDRLFSENRVGSWYYHNSGSDSVPNFTFYQDDFLMENMLDFGSGAMPLLTDYDQDGKTDLLVANYGNYDFGDFVPQISLYRNVGTNDMPFFDLIVEDLADLSFQFYSPGIRPALGDLDNDGDMDMLLGKADGTLDFFRNFSLSPGNILPQFGLEGEDYLGIDVGGSATPQLIDLNGDQLLDLLIGERDGNLNYYENTGTAEVPDFSLVTNSFGGINVSIDGFQPGYSVPVVFTQGPHLSLIVGGDEGKAWYFQEIETDLMGDFGAGEIVIQDGTEGNRLSPFVADLNADGYPEMLLGNFGGGISLHIGIEPDSNMVSVVSPLSATTTQIKLFPNPAIDRLFWEQSSSIAGTFEVRLFDLHGRLISQWDLQGNSGELMLPILPAGLYVTEIEVVGQPPVRNKVWIKQ